MEQMPRHTRWEVFLGTVELNATEKRVNRWMGRLVAYSFFVFFVGSLAIHVMWVTITVGALFTVFLVLTTAPGIVAARRRRQELGLPVTIPKSERKRLREIWRPRWHDFVGMSGMLLLGVTALTFSRGRTFSVAFGVGALAIGVTYLTAIALWYRWKRSEVPAQK
jgi:hypothetical protein